MIAKMVFHKVMSQIHTGSLTVQYWDKNLVKYGDTKPYFHMKINHPRALRAILSDLALGFGESYMNGDIEIDGPITAPGRLISENAQAFAKLGRLALPHHRQRNRRGRQRRQIASHYDLGNEFYKLWLDDSMTYSCAYFQHDSDSLEIAQNQKVDYILRKLRLQKGQSLLDIGCGWGKLLITAAQEYGVSGHGVTLSEEQFKLATERVTAAGLSGKVTIELANYQDLVQTGRQFDRIVSVGMYEHVGRSNQATYFKTIDALLAPHGLSVLHTITDPNNAPIDPWIDRYIFPGGFIPPAAGILKSLEAQGFELQDYENLRFHYAHTLEDWLERFEAHKDQVIERYGEEFYRMWRLYLGSSASGFRYGQLGLSQFTFTRLAQTGQPLTRGYLYQ
jgi:cyclopropane-fatty-acyl-phospholipid synthase